MPERQRLPDADCLRSMLYTFMCLTGTFPSVGPKLRAWPSLVYLKPGRVRSPARRSQRRQHDGNKCPLRLVPTKSELGCKEIHSSSSGSPASLEGLMRRRCILAFCRCRVSAWGGGRCCTITAIERSMLLGDRPLWARSCQAAAQHRVSPARLQPGRHVRPTSDLGLLMLSQNACTFADIGGRQGGASAKAYLRE